jgi:hypothetical protein
MSGFRDLPVTK